MRVILCLTKDRPSRSGARKESSQKLIHMSNRLRLGCSQLMQVICQKAKLLQASQKSRLRLNKSSTKSLACPQKYQLGLRMRIILSTSSSLKLSKLISQLVRMCFAHRHCVISEIRNLAQSLARTEPFNSQAPWPSRLEKCLQSANLDKQEAWSPLRGYLMSLRPRLRFQTTSKKLNSVQSMSFLKTMSSRTMIHLLSDRKTSGC